MIKKITFNPEDYTATVRREVDNQKVSITDYPNYKFIDALRAIAPDVLTSLGLKDTWSELELSGVSWRHKGEDLKSLTFSFVNTLDAFDVKGSCTIPAASLSETVLSKVEQLQLEAQKFIGGERA
jgi:hypothetical protein